MSGADRSVPDENRIMCPICSGPVDPAPVFTRQSFEIFKCPGCTVRFVFPQPSPEELSAIYARDYFHRGGKYFGQNQDESADLQRATNDRRIELVRRYKKRGKLLDVGCAEGGFLRAARDAGYEVKGVELSSYSAGIARRHVEDVVIGAVESANFPSGCFDVITLWDVIEHLPDPVMTMKVIGNLLAPGGVVLFTTGDISSRVARVLGSRWHLLTPPQHLFFFTPKSVDHLLAAAGLHLDSVRYPGKWVPIGLILLKAEESYSRLFARLYPLLKRFGLNNRKLYLNLFDIMTVVARKKAP